MKLDRHELHASRRTAQRRARIQVVADADGGTDERDEQKDRNNHTRRLALRRTHAVLTAKKQHLLGAQQADDAEVHEVDGRRVEQIGPPPRAKKPREQRSVAPRAG